MSALTLLYPNFGSGRDHVIYHKSASERSIHYFILISDPDVFKRTGIRIATFSYDKNDVQYDKAIVRYGNTSPRIRLPNRPFETAVEDAIRHHEGVFKVASIKAPRSRKIRHKLEWLIERVFQHDRHKKLRNS